LALGAKLAAGLEMLYVESKQSNAGQEDGEKRRRSVLEDKNWSSFQAALIKRSYFQGEMEGSKEFKRLQAVAIEHFIDSGMSGGGAAQSTREQIDAILALPHREVDFSASDIRADDDDSWLDVTPEHLEALLAAKGAASGGDVPEMGGDLGSEMQNLFASMSGMVNSVSEFDGAR